MADKHDDRQHSQSEDATTKPIKGIDNTTMADSSVQCDDHNDTQSTKTMTMTMGKQGDGQQKREAKETTTNDRVHQRKRQ